MAIDPSLINTVRVEDLPIAAITPESIIAHSIDGVLYQGTVAEIMALVPSVNYKPYELKILNVTDLYADNNFELTGPSWGLGKTGGLWEGWAIMNGNNGTRNLDGYIIMGFGATQNTMGEEVGEDTKNFNVPVSGYGVGDPTDSGVSGRLIVSSGLPESGEFLESLRKTTVTGPAINLSIKQKSRVQLIIMKLP